MKLRGLLAGVPLSGDGIDLEMEISSLCCRPEELVPGALYVQLPGAALTARQALDRGAAAAVGPEGAGRAGCLGCADPWLALSLLAANWLGRPGEGLTLLAVAGEEESAQLLRLALEGTPGNRVGLITPDRGELDGETLPRSEPGGYGLELLLETMARRGCTHGVLLLDREGAQRRESAGLRLCAAAELPGRDGPWSALWEQSDMVVLNLDEAGAVEYGNTVSRPILTYSENKAGADLTARNLRVFPGHLEFEAVTLGQICRVHLPAAGGFTLYNALCALSCGLCAGLELEQMARALRSAHGRGERLEVVPVPAAYTVVLDGARTPRELERALVSARAFTAGRLICLFGSPEGEAPALRAQMGGVAGQLADQVILTADDPGQERATDIIRDILSGMGDYRRPCCVEPDREQAIRYALGQARAGDVIVLAGKGRRTTQRVGRSLVPLDEREIVSRYFRRPRRRRGSAPGA